MVSLSRGIGGGDILAGIFGSGGLGWKYSAITSERLSDWDGSGEEDGFGGV